MRLLIFLTLVMTLDCRLPQEYEEVDDQEVLLFTVNQPFQLAFTYQFKQSYMLGSHFKHEPNRTMRNIRLVLADPPNACKPLTNKLPFDTAVLIERGECSFTEKVNNAYVAGAVLAMVTNTYAGMGEFREYVNMVPDSSLRLVKIPCVYIAPLTGRYFRSQLQQENGQEILMDIPVQKVNSNWFQHQRKAPWEHWGDELWWF